MSTKNSSGPLIIGFVLLVGCARDPVEGLVGKLQDSRAEVRRAAASELEKQPNGDERVIVALTKSASDSDVEVRYRSMSALAKLGPAAKSSLPALKSMLQDPEKAVRLRAALAIAKIDPQDRAFLPVVVAAMREGDGRTLLEVGAMGPGADWAVPTLVGLLGHESPKVRALAAKALGGIGPVSKDVKPALERAALDQSVAVQTAAKYALKRLETPATRAPAQKTN